MKITAEFNSNEELLSFINTFGAKTIEVESKQDVQASVEVKKEVEKEQPKKEEIKKEESKSVDPPKEDKKENVTSTVKNTEAEKGDKEDKPIITMEMVRAVFTKLIQSGKQKEAKELTLKYGAGKLPELKEEDYAAVLKEAEALL